MALHFSREELAKRRKNVCSTMAEIGLKGILIFRQESMFYLTGYDTFGFCFFQCLFLNVNGAMTLLTRAPDLRQARHTSVIEDIRIWTDTPDAKPAEELKSILADHNCKGAQLGIEWDSYGLTALEGMRIQQTMDGFCNLINASDLIDQLRVIKSDSEMVYVRRAAVLADESYDLACELAQKGAFEGDILAAMQGAIFKGGGDYPGNEFIIGSGENALLCRYFTGRRSLNTHDQLTLEWAGAYRHYHAAMMRTLIIGKAPDRQKHMFNVCCDALAAVQAAIKPGNTFGQAFDAHAQVIDAADMQEHRLNACGYSLGTTFSPIWMDRPMLYHGNTTEFQPNMVIFCHMIIFDSDTTLAMTLGETIHVTQSGCDRLSSSPWELVEN
ncbi:MAG: Xaa-Pro dipeptidase [Magnetovibrio sp.]|nr:Xaa-Pro dipeptidase [Magnetovibrio sp.]|tara:strand:+ start:344 stop:1495 length:1152 start_codon:yes stop_codon:yes gene_type:complete